MHWGIIPSTQHTQQEDAMNPSGGSTRSGQGQYSTGKDSTAKGNKGCGMVAVALVALGGLVALFAPLLVQAG